MSMCWWFPRATTGSPWDGLHNALLRHYGLLPRCGTKPTHTERHNRLTLFSGAPRHERLRTRSTIRNPSRREAGLYNVLGARLHNRIGGSQANASMATTTTTKWVNSQLQELGFARNPRTRGPSSKWGGNGKLIGEDVDLDALEWFSEDQRIWVVECGDLRWIGDLAPLGLGFDSEWSK